MFRDQKQLQKLAMDKNLNLPSDMPLLFYMHATACMVELAEAIQMDTRWKASIGSKRPLSVNKEGKLLELVDAMHFLINAVLYSGFSYQNFVEAFFKKGKVNVERQNGNQ